MHHAAPLLSRAQVHTTPHVLYLTRHGQSEYNVLGKIGGNPPLSVRGAEYAKRLGEWVRQ